MLGYYIVSHAGKGLYLTVDAAGTITGRTNVGLGLLSFENVNQMWLLPGSSMTGIEVSSANNPSYMLNARKSTWNCDVYTSNADTVLNFLLAGDGCYKIQLNSDQSRYLTAAGTSPGSNVDWQIATSANANAQLWKLVETSVPDQPSEKSIPFPSSRNCLWNQKDPIVIEALGTEYGCTIVSGLNAANFYGPKNYTIQDIASQWIPGTGYTWRFPSGCAGKLNNATPESDYAVLRAKVVEQINLGNGRPMLIRVSGYDSKGKIHYHSVVAYGYTNNAATNADILVIDPYNPDSKTVARKTTLAVINKTRPTLENYRTTQPVTV